MGFFSKRNISRKCSLSKSISKKTFRKVFKVATTNLLFVEQTYKREFGKAASDNPDSYRKWFVSKYGAVNLNDL